MQNIQIVIGNYLKIENEDVSMIYAHCKALYVKEGDKINLGQEIAEVGKSGKATGPHLHFEVSIQGRELDPMYILNF